MHSYVAFGMELDCDFAIPELMERPSSTGSAWRVRTCRTDPPQLPVEPTGVDTVYGSVRVRGYSGGQVSRLVFDDTGTFDISGCDRTITWYPGRESRDVAVRADLLGRVVSLAVHADGGLALHASAVSVSGRAIAFLGDKHAGKSTLALALVRRGARLITDDTLVVQRFEAGSAWVAPGIQRARLWEDSARALDLVPESGTAIEKPTIDALAPDRLEGGVVPLDACYALQPVAAVAGGACVARDRLAPVQAALTGVRFAKLAPLLGGREGPAVLDRAARLAGATTFYVAAVLRDLHRLDEVAARIIEWHAAAPNAGASP